MSSPARTAVDVFEGAISSAARLSSPETTRNHNHCHLHRHDQRDQRITQQPCQARGARVCLMTLRAVAITQDPSGRIKGYLHPGCLEEHGPLLGAGAALLLKEVRERRRKLASCDPAGLRQCAHLCTYHKHAPSKYRLVPAHLLDIMQTWSHDACMSSMCNNFFP